MVISNLKGYWKTLPKYAQPILFLAPFYISPIHLHNLCISAWYNLTVNFTSCPIHPIIHIPDKKVVRLNSLYSYPLYAQIYRSYKTEQLIRAQTQLPTEQLRQNDALQICCYNVQWCVSKQRCSQSARWRPPVTPLLSEQQNAVTICWSRSVHKAYQRDHYSQQNDLDDVYLNITSNRNSQKGTEWVTTASNITLISATLLNQVQ